MKGVKIEGMRKMIMFMIVLMSLFVLVFFGKVSGSEMVDAMTMIFGFFVGGNIGEYAFKDGKQKPVSNENH